jgi:uncharacterized protein
LGVHCGSDPVRPKSRTLGKMKKRVRKKKHRGEFAEWGRQLVITRNRKDEFDEFLDAFIAEAIEANGCFCGGGGKEERLDLIVELGRRSEDPGARLKNIAAWLDSRPDVQRWKIGEEVDIWNGDFEDTENPIEQAAPAERPR